MSSRAYAAPASRIDRAEKRRPTALVLAPTRELAEQISRELAPLAGSCARRVGAVYGGASESQQRRMLDRGVDARLERNDRAPAPAAVGRHDELRLRVVHAVAHRLGRESAEHDRVRGADARTCEHRDRELGHERHVEADAVARLDRDRTPARLAAALPFQTDEAIAAVPTAMVEDIALVGPKDKIADDLERWGPLIKSLGVSLD